jgi:hypothetical protein
MTRRTALLVSCALCWFACRTEHANLVSDPDAGKHIARDAAVQPPADAGTRAAAGSGSTTPQDAGPHIASANCDGLPCACDDGVDNDGDGFVDGLDPECTGSFDNDETTFGIGKPNKQSGCRDCFWDDNSGSGDDGCRYASECLRGTELMGNGNCTCQASDKCLDTCRPRTPNGCDCFGCCQVFGVDHTIELNDTCTLERLDDPVACPPCVQNTVCFNPCGRCELCLGKRPSDLPADCKPKGSGPAYACDEGERVCTSSAECAGASYCELGCCLVELL